jgi:catechol 2,3-dioxygenase-like lactoylglutathione lyase family enzyme
LVIHLFAVYEHNDICILLDRAALAEVSQHRNRWLPGLYRTTELRQRDDRPDFGFGGAWLDIGDQQVHLIESAVPDDCGQHFAIRVADIEAAVSALRERAIEVSDPKPVAASRQCFLRDPSGNLIELHEPSVTSGV